MSHWLSIQQLIDCRHPEIHNETLTLVYSSLDLYFLRIL